MLKSYFSQAVRGRVIIRRPVLHQLGIGPNGVIYGALFPQERAAILSPIPPDSWRTAFKIILHTAALPGSVASAATAIAGLKLDVVSSWVSNDSLLGHTCFTSIVVSSPGNIQKLGGASGIRDQLSIELGQMLSDIDLFSEASLEPVRVTPLAILRSYREAIGDDAEFYRIALENHNLDIGKPNATRAADALENEFPDDDNNLWRELLSASNTAEAKACILTPNTEEALLRLVLVPESSRLCRLAFRLVIESANESYTGYWGQALQELARKRCSVFVAHNLIIDRSAKPPRESAEFHFVFDRSRSSDVGSSLRKLEGIWKSRLTDSFSKLAQSRGDAAAVEHLKITMPRGIGVPCFFSCNAKPSDGPGAEAAVKICKLLEGHGFKPVNVDLAEGSQNLRKQVYELVSVCRFLVVLYCPEDRLLLNEEAIAGVKKNEIYSASEWVMFEEGIMEGIGGQSLRLRFSNVRGPAYTQGYPEIEIPETGLDQDIIANISARLDRWGIDKHEQSSDNLLGSAVPMKHLERDLIAYYEGSADEMERPIG